jgi:uncharacterized protein YutE (UPF0331/DUF86 family)
MNDVVINKAQSIQRCIKRAREELDKAGDNFKYDYTRQDAAILNLTRACEQAIDLANHLIKCDKLGIPSDSRQSFDLLSAAGIITAESAGKLKKMIGFRNTAIHEYQQINLHIVEIIIVKESSDLLRFTEDALSWAKKRENENDS